MKRTYTGLGSNDTSVARRDDPLLRHTGAAAAKLVQMMKSGQAAQIDAALAKADSTLPAVVRRLADHIQRTRGWTRERSMHEALTLALADMLMARFRRLGTQAAEGDATALSGRRSLGGLGTDPPERVLENLARGVACSRGLQTSTTDVAGRQEGRTAADATSVGFELARSFATCPEESQPSTPLPPAQPPSDDSSNIIVPVVIGIGALAVLGGVIWMTRK